MEATQPLWTPVGPAPEDATGFGVAGGVSGRPWTIAFSSDFDGLGTAALYLGIAGGGVWRSTNFGSGVPDWNPLTDSLPASFPLDRQVGLQNIGALAVDPNHPWIIFAGTGDPAEPGGNLYGHGLIKSIDGGSTWTLLALGSQTFTPGFSRIFVDPTDSSGNTIYATGGFGPSSPLRGIFTSNNGGTSWTPIHNGMPPAVAVTDLDFSITNGRLSLFAGVTDATGTNSSANGLWTSTDGGSTWTQMQILPLFDLGTGNTVDQSAIGLIKLAVDRSPGSSHGAFAAIGNGLRLMNVFKLVGDTWVPTGGNGLTDINITSALSIGISPQGDVYVGGVNDSHQNGIFQTRDGGASWTSIDVGSNGLRPHTDQHAWEFFGDAVYNGNDGGVYRFTPLPSAAGPGTWESLNTSSLQTILTQGVSIHPQDPAVLLEGSQDNGVALRTAGSWKYVAGDDDRRCKFDPHDPQFAYRTGVSDFHFFFRSDDGGVTWPDDRSVPGSPAVQDFAPFAFHPIDAGRIALGLDRVYETRNRGDDLWKAISGPLAGNGENIGALAYGGGDVLYVSFGPRLFMTTDDGGDASDANWKELLPGNDWHGGIVSIVVDPQNAQRVYLATNGGSVWQSPNQGVSWNEITADYPGSIIGINALDLRSDSSTIQPTLFVGSAVGVYISNRSDPTPHWSRLGTGLPDVSVTDLQFNNATKTLVAGTYGRGVFTISVPAPTARCKDVTVPTDPNVCSADNISIDNGSTAVNGDSFILTQTPPPPYSEGITSVALTITDEQNAQTNTCSASVTVLDQQLPDIACPAPIVECTSPGGTPVTFAPIVSDNCPGVGLPSCQPPTGSIFQLGSTPFSCSVSDTSNNKSTCNSVVMVRDTSSPVIVSVGATPGTLWPPNHNVVPVTVAVIAADACDSSPLCRIVSVSSNEPVWDPGSGDTSPDWIISDPGPKASPANFNVQLRAERSGRRTGRIYTINVSCSDASGNTASSNTIVSVPHDQGH